MNFNGKILDVHFNQVLNTNNISRYIRKTTFIENNFQNYTETNNLWLIQNVNTYIQLSDSV